MHQYTADLANRRLAAGDEVCLVTTERYPASRYAPEVALHRPVDTRDAGFSTGAIRDSAFGIRRVSAVLRELQPDVVHFSGPHLWNPLLLRAMRRAGIPALHTVHDLHPHAGAVYGRLLYAWNRWVVREADHLLVHGERWREELLSRGVKPERVTSTPLTHLFVGYEGTRALEASPPAVEYEPWALFVGRLLPYKGLEVLVEAARRVEGQGAGIVIAGPGRLEGLVRGEIPANVEVRAGLAGDEEAVDLFRHCGLVVLPYVEASQSALVAAAYFFGKPVIVTRAGALPEYVVEGETGWVVPPGDAQALAATLETALADPQRLARMGRAGRAWYEEQRGAESEALGALYRGLARRGRA